MIFCSASGSPDAVPAVSSAGVAGGSGVGAGATGAGGGGTGARSREIGGRKARFTALSASLLFGFGFFSSISETLSTVRWTVGAGLGSDGFSTGFSDDVTGAFGVDGALALGLAGASTAAGLEIFAGEGAFALF